MSSWQRQDANGEILIHSPVSWPELGFLQGLLDWVELDLFQQGIFNALKSMGEYSELFDTESS